MRTVILGPRPPEVEALIESRRKWGADRHDEVWNGDLHMNPAPRFPHQYLEAHLAELLGPIVRGAGLVLLGGVNIGDPDDFRIPDLTVVRELTDTLYGPTAELVVEILSPWDETRRKLPFYAARGVAEVVIVDPAKRTVEWLWSDGAAFTTVTHSALLDLDVAEFTESIDWPPVSDAE